METRQIWAIRVIFGDNIKNTVAERGGDDRYKLGGNSLDSSGVKLFPLFLYMYFERTVLVLIILLYCLYGGFLSQFIDMRFILLSRLVSDRRLLVRLRNSLNYCLN